jgi:uncharacterized protein (DUF305 family)
MRRGLLVCLPALSIVLAGAVSAQTQPSPANKSFMAAMESMHADKQKGMEPNSIRAWEKLMIAQRRGAIDMSETVLKESTDPTIRKMARKGMDEQRKGQKMLREWVSKRGG